MRNCDVSLLQLSLGDVFFMVDCLLSAFLGYKCKLYDSSHTLGSPQAMEGVSTTLDLVFLLYFG